MNLQLVWGSPPVGHVLNCLPSWEVTKESPHQAVAHCHLHLVSILKIQNHATLWKLDELEHHVIRAHSLEEKKSSQCFFLSVFFTIVVSPASSSRQSFDTEILSYFSVCCSFSASYCSNSTIVCCEGSSPIEIASSNSSKFSPCYRTRKGGHVSTLEATSKRGRLPY